MKYRVTLFFVLALTWALWSGYTDPMLVTLGVISVGLTVGLSERMGLLDDEGAPLTLLRPASWRYLLWLAAEILKSALHVTRVVLSPSMPISPRYLYIHPTQKTDFGKAIYANSITLTPGTVTVAVDGDSMLIHALTIETADGLLTGDMDARVTRLESGA